jgi:hypothetical protein
LPRFNQDHHALLGRPSPCGGALASFPPHRPSAARRPSSCPARAASAARRTTVVIASATRLNSWHDRAHFLAPRAPARRPPCRGRRRLGRARRRRPAGPLRGVPARRRQRRRTRGRARGRRGWSAGGRRVPHAREVEPPGGASLESWARLDDLTVRATRALNIGVYGPSEGVRPTSPLLSRLLESNSPVVEHVRTDKTFSDQSPHIALYSSASRLLNPDHPAARPGPCPRRRRPVHRDVSLLHAADEPGVRGGGTTATTPEAEGEPGHHQLLQSLLEGTYIPDLPPSITSSRINVRLAGSDLTQETSLSSVLQLPLAL